MRAPQLARHRLDTRATGSLVLIASPAAAVRRRWGQALEGTYANQQVAERAALDRSMGGFKPAVLLADLALPGFGIPVVPDVQRLSPSTKILVFTGAPNEKEAISALKAGVKGYYNRDIDPILLKKAVEMVQKGEIWVGRNIIPHLLLELTAVTMVHEQPAPAKVGEGLERLTAREREIAQLIGGGASNKEIASRLNITERTVKAHLTTVFRKLGVSDRLRLALLVMGRPRGVA